MRQNLCKNDTSASAVLRSVSQKTAMADLLTMRALRTTVLLLVVSLSLGRSAAAPALLQCIPILQKWLLQLTTLRVLQHHFSEGLTMQVGSRYVAAAVKLAYPRSLTQIMRLMAPKMWITVTTIAKDQSVITMMATMYLALRSTVPRVPWSFVRPLAGLTACHEAYRIDTQHYV